MITKGCDFSAEISALHFFCWKSVDISYILVATRVNEGSWKTLLFWIYRLFYLTYTASEKVEISKQESLWTTLNLSFIVFTLVFLKL